MSAADANARLALAVSTIAFGYFLKRVGLVDVDVGKAMLKVLFNATLPAMLLMTFASLTFDATSVAVSLCAMAQAAVLFVAHLAFKGTGRDPKDTALLAGSCVGVNLGTFAYPLVEAVWGTAGVTRLVLFDAVNQWSLLIVAPLIYASVIAGASFSLVQALGNVKKQLLSPCLLAMFAAVALRVLGLGLNGPAVSFLSSLAVANKPLALLALGVLFEPALRGGQLRDVASLLALRYGAGLLLGAALLAKFASAGPAVLGGPAGAHLAGATAHGDLRGGVRVRRGARRGRRERRELLLVRAVDGGRERRPLEPRDGEGVRGGGRRARRARRLRGSARRRRRRETRRRAGRHGNRGRGGGRDHGEQRARGRWW